MKKLLLSLMLALVCQLSMAQTAKSVFDEYKSKNNVAYVSVPSALIQIGAAKIKDERAKEVVGQVKSARMLNLDDCKKSVRKKFVKAIEKLRKQGYDEATNMKNSSDNILILTKGNSSTLEEVVILINNNPDVTAILFTGNISVDAISSLVGLAETF